ncbi:hypothetical protein [Changchengzhania lutea]|uniref:hypothetical protein n=1 Tax=Changchengzhania lutea TaxID=2049305 RepID=UPI00115E1B84|nr:hypothetical protein [Changchengzhania lutea]
MKRIVLLITGVLMSLTTVSASDITSEKQGTNLDITNRYRYVQPIMFVERDVEFLIFPDGSFDFNTNYNMPFYDDVFYKNRRSKRSTINATYHGPRATVHYTNTRARTPRDVSISRDRYGKIRRIGSVYLNYNRIGNISRIGSVFIDYKRGKGTVSHVGGLHVKYNKWGEIMDLRGHVNNYDDTYCNICGVTGCNVQHTFGKHEKYGKERHHDRYDDDTYYYKQNGKVKKHKKKKH